MSRSAPTADKPQNPAVHFFEWAGGATGGYLQFWDKPQKQTVQCDAPFQFLALDELKRCVALDGLLLGLVPELEVASGCSTGPLEEVNGWVG